eukprot:scaffold584553_cov22-Prasinocladus_malaysianus.AAC.1
MGNGNSPRAHHVLILVYNTQGQNHRAVFFASYTDPKGQVAVLMQGKAATSGSYYAVSLMLALFLAEAMRSHL